MDRLQIANWSKQSTSHNNFISALKYWVAVGLNNDRRQQRILATKRVRLHISLWFQHIVSTVSRTLPKSMCTQMIGAECEDFRVAAHQQIHRLTADRYRCCTANHIPFELVFSYSGTVHILLILYIYIIDGDNIFSKLDTCVQLIYIPPHALQSNRGVLRNKPKSSHLPLEEMYHGKEGWQACHRCSLHCVVMEPPSGLLWRPPIAAVPNIAVVVCRALLQPYTAPS
jgi:hypothetical protein